FFFQAEDGIRDFHVTGVQTCALPICIVWLLPGGARGVVHVPLYPYDERHEPKSTRLRDEFRHLSICTRCAGIFVHPTAIFVRSEIGRASCRESVWVGVGSGGIE